MFGVLLLIAFALIYGLLVRWAERRDDGAPATGLLVGFWRNTSGALAPWALTLYVLAVAATLGLVLGEVDGPFQRWMQHNDPMGSTLSWGFLIVGNFWPLVLALGLYFKGRRRNPRLAGAGVAAFQALAAAFLYIGALKILSGRAAPHHYFDGELIDVAWRTTADAADWSFAFWTHAPMDGRFMWPSGHTASAIAIVSSLVAFAPERRWLAWVGYPIVALTALAMVDGDFHWTSDVVAGALIGHVLGWSIGRAVRNNPRFAAAPAPALPAGG